MNKLIRSLTSLSYCVGFFDEKFLTADKATRYSQVAWLDTGDYRDGWFADPFFCDIDGDVLGGKKAGTDTCAALWGYGQKDALLEAGPDYAFSSPRELCSLLLDEEKIRETLTDGRVLVGASLLDPSLFEMEGKFFLMGTEGANDRRLADTRLRIYASDSLNGPFSPVQTIENRKRVERGAGCIFRTAGGTWIRPTQSCERRYGECVLLQELKYENGLFSERCLSRIEPDETQPNSYCLHTLNTLDGLCVIDGLSFRYPLLGPALIRLLDRRAQKHAANG